MQDILLMFMAFFLGALSTLIRDLIRIEYERIRKRRNRKTDQLLEFRVDIIRMVESLHNI